MKRSHWLVTTATLLLLGCSDRQTLPTEARPPASAPGRNSFGHLGIGTSDFDPHPLPVPVQQPAGVAFTAVSLGQVSSEAAACQPFCWGANYRGQLGDGSVSERWLPVPTIR